MGPMEAGGTGPPTDTTQVLVPTALGTPRVPVIVLLVVLHLEGTASHDTHLEVVVRAWPTLPDALKAGILAMVRASGRRV